MDSKIRPETRWFFLKFALLVTFVVFDVYLNSKNEYEAMVIGDEGIDKLSQHQMLLFGYSILLQFSIASTLFLILCSTLPFQVGLLFPFQEGIFKLLLVLQLLYMISSCIVGGLRLNNLFVSANTDLFRSWVYRTVSAMHKLVAPCYYAASVRSALTLGHSKYYTKDAWISSAQQK